MRRWEVRGFGLEALALASGDDLPAPGPGRIRLRMSAWSLNYRDLLLATGAYDPRLPLPYVPLSDGIGVVDAVGDGVKRVVVGDRVCPTFAPGWIDGRPDADTVRTSRGGPTPGVLAEQFDVDADDVVKVPAHLTDAEAATLPCAGLTAYSAVIQLGRLSPGQTCLVIGSGGVSLFAAQLAQRCGARVAAITRTAANVPRLRELGVTHVVDSTVEPRWGRAIRAWSGGGVDLVVEVGGAGTFERSLEATRVGGTVAVIGNLAGSREPISVLPILMRALRCEGVFVGHRRGFEALCAALAAHRDHPVLDRCFPFEEAPAAFAHLAAGSHFGKICITR